MLVARMQIQRVAAVLAAAIATPALAQPVIIADSGDSAWMLAATVLALLATVPGLAMLRGRNAQLAFAVLLSAAIAALMFVAIGYSLAFGDGSPMLGGVGNVLLADLAELRGGTTISESIYALYETVVAMFALALLAGTLGARARLGWLIPFVALWLLVVYVPVARWLWGGGWLADIGALDFAGGVVVQTTVGVAALVVGLLLRRRDDATVTISPVGAGLYTIGWLSIIGGATLGAGDDAAIAIVDALLAGSVGMLAGAAIGGWRTRAMAVDEALTGTLAALAAAGTSAGFVGPLGAILLGLVAAIAACGLLCPLARLHTGDAGHAFATFGVGGVIGAVLFPLFVQPVFGGPGLDEGASIVTQLAAQGVAVVAIVLWTAVATVIIALAVSIVVPMRSAATG